MTDRYFDVASEAESMSLRKLVLMTFWLINNEDSRQALKRARKEWEPGMGSEHAKQLLTDRPLPVLQEAATPVVLDRWWATFFATGDPGPIKRIAAQLRLFDGSGQEILTGGAARWSLASNCVQHPRVREIVESLREEADPEQAARLDEVLSRADEAEERAPDKVDRDPKRPE